MFEFENVRGRDEFTSPTKRRVSNRRRGVVNPTKYIDKETLKNGFEFVLPSYSLETPAVSKSLSQTISCESTVSADPPFEELRNKLLVRDIHLGREPGDCVVPSLLSLPDSFDFEAKYVKLGLYASNFNLLLPPKVDTLPSQARKTDDVPIKNVQSFSGVQPIDRFPCTTQIMLDGSVMLSGSKGFEFVLPSYSMEIPTVSKSLSQTISCESAVSAVSADPPFEELRNKLLVRDIHLGREPGDCVVPSLLSLPDSFDFDAKHVKLGLHASNSILTSCISGQSDTFEKGVHKYATMNESSSSSSTKFNDTCVSVELVSGDTRFFESVSSSDTTYSEEATDSLILEGADNFIDMLLPPTSTDDDPPDFVEFRQDNLAGILSPVSSRSSVSSDGSDTFTMGSTLFSQRSGSSDERDIFSSLEEQHSEESDGRNLDENVSPNWLAKALDEYLKNCEASNSSECLGGLKSGLETGSGGGGEFYVQTTKIVDYIQSRVDGRYQLVLGSKERDKIEKIVPLARRANFLDAVRHQVERVPVHPTSALHFLTLRCQALGLDRKDKNNPILAVKRIVEETPEIKIPLTLFCKNKRAIKNAKVDEVANYEESRNHGFDNVQSSVIATRAISSNKVVTAVG